MKVAGILRLHREETYNLPPKATTDDIVDSETARRTFWVLESKSSASKKFEEVFDPHVYKL